MWHTSKKAKYPFETLPSKIGRVEKGSLIALSCHPAGILPIEGWFDAKLKMRFLDVFAQPYRGAL